MMQKQCVPHNCSLAFLLKHLLDWDKLPNQFQGPRLGLTDGHFCKPWLPRFSNKEKRDSPSPVHRANNNFWCIVTIPCHLSRYKSENSWDHHYNIIMGSWLYMMIIIIKYNIIPTSGILTAPKRQSFLCFEKELMFFFPIFLNLSLYCTISIYFRYVSVNCHKLPCFGHESSWFRMGTSWLIQS